MCCSRHSSQLLPPVSFQWGCLTPTHIGENKCRQTKHTSSRLSTNAQEDRQLNTLWITHFLLFRGFFLFCFFSDLILRHIHTHSSLLVLIRLVSHVISFLHWHISVKAIICCLFNMLYLHPQLMLDYGPAFTSVIFCLAFEGNTEHSRSYLSLDYMIVVSHYSYCARKLRKFVHCDFACFQLYWKIA